MVFSLLKYYSILSSVSKIPSEKNKNAPTLTVAKQAVKNVFVFRRISIKKPREKLSAFKTIDF